MNERRRRRYTVSSIRRKLWQERERGGKTKREKEEKRKREAKEKRSGGRKEDLKLALNFFFGESVTV